MTATSLRRSVVLALVAVAATLALAVPSSAAPAVDGEFTLSGDGNRIAQGPDGNMWLTLSGDKEIARITPQGDVTEYDIDAFGNSTGIVAGPDDKLWITRNTEVGRFDPADPVGTATTFPADIAAAGTIVAGPDGNLWTASADKVLRITPTGDATSFAILTQARGITSSGGLIWVVDFGTGELVSVTPDGTPTRYLVGGTPQEVAAGLDGQVAYTNPSPPQRVGRLIAGGSPLPTNVRDGTDPFGITFGSDQAYWFAQAFGNNVGRLTADGAYSEIGNFGPGANPRYLAAGPGNTIWVLLQELGGEGGKKVIRISGLEPPQPPIPVGEAKAPIVSKLSLTAKRFRVGKKRTAITARKRGAKRRKAAPAGTRIRFTLNKAATVRISIERKLAGRRRAGKKCTKPTRTNRKAKRCTRLKKSGTLTRRNLAAGKRTIAFTGRIGRKALKPGNYRLTVIATDASGAASKPQRVSFTVLSAKR